MSRQGLRRGARRAVVLGLGTAALALLPTAAPTVEAADPPSPDRYLQINWVVGRAAHRIAKEGSRWEVIGRHGKLEIDFDREGMREDWEFDTPALLSLRGFVDSPESGRRNIEIPGYSTVKDGLKVVELDLGAATGVVQQMFQGARVAHRIAATAARAELKGLKAEMATIRKRVKLQDGLVADVERAIGVLYNEAFAFLLDERDVREAAETIAAARARLAQLEDAHRAGKRREVEVFWSEIDAQRTGIEAWLDGVLDDKNRPYLSIVAPIVGREENVILAVGESIRELLQGRAKGAMTPEAEARAMARLTLVAERVTRLERDLHVRYRTLAGSGAERLTLIENAPQYARRAGDKKSLEDLFKEVEGVRKSIKEQVDASLGGLPEDRDLECWPDRDRTPSAVLRAPQVTAAERAQRRFEVIEARLRELVGSSGFAAAQTKALKHFEAEAKAALAERRAAKEELRRIAKEFRTKEAKYIEKHGWQSDCRPLTRLGDRLEAVLVTQVIHALIDRIPRVTLSLDALDLEPGDTLGIVASFLPPRSAGAEPPAQQTCTFEVVPWGWDGPVPDGKEMLSFVEGEDQDGFAPAFGTAALWHWYGRSQRRPSAKRTFAPGFGIAAHFLDFDEDESTIEIGIGPVVSFFDDILHVGYGWNLQAKGTPSYFAVGVSFTSVVDKFKKKD